MKKYLLQGEDIQMLTQQRPPILMVDVLFDANEEEAFTGLLIQPDNMFCINGQLIESGIIEHIAQTASVFAGYKALQAHQPIVLG
ncbi:MAG: hydroxymyristoyl-ACP dehydratase, partial [Bacteroidales bacterium]|nr:hydroxymyristoyl-ACP dehydratase [Bacteroidales bacterium]